MERNDVFDLSQIESKPVGWIPTGLYTLDYCFSGKVELVIEGGKIITSVKGGVPRGLMSLWAGQAGIGKSRMLIFMSSLINISTRNKILYIQNEVNGTQFKQWVDGFNSQLRNYGQACGHAGWLDAIDTSRFLMSNATDYHRHLEIIEQHRPDLVIIDSVNMLEGFNSSSQIRQMLTSYKNVTSNIDAHTILVGHLAKDGTIKGSTDVPHLVDIVVNLHRDKYIGDDYINIDSLFFLTVGKNRVGPSGEWICVQHTDSGIDIEPGNPSSSLQYKNIKGEFQEEAARLSKQAKGYKQPRKGFLDALGGIMGIGE